MRTCGKMRCGNLAAATVALRYEDREVLVGDLLSKLDPNLLDLCRIHAERLVPPLGWHVKDQRSS